MNLQPLNLFLQLLYVYHTISLCLQDNWDDEEEEEKEDEQKVEQNKTGIVVKFTNLSQADIFIPLGFFFRLNLNIRLPCVYACLCSSPLNDFIYAFI